MNRKKEILDRIDDLRKETSMEIKQVWREHYEKLAALRGELKEVESEEKA